MSGTDSGIKSLVMVNGSIRDSADTTSPSSTNLGINGKTRGSIIDFESSDKWSTCKGGASTDSGIDGNICRSIIDSKSSDRPSCKAGAAASMDSESGIDENIHESIIDSKSSDRPSCKAGGAGTELGIDRIGRVQSISGSLIGSPGSTDFDGQSGCQAGGVGGFGLKGGGCQCAPWLAFFKISVEIHWQNY
jgi:hypothetical protein